MRRLLPILAIFLLGVSSLGLGLTSALRRTVASPDFFYSLLDHADLPAASFAAAERVAGKNSPWPAVAKLAVARFEAEFKQQSHAELLGLFEALRKPETRLRFVFRLNTIRHDAQFAAALADSLPAAVREKVPVKALLPALAQRLLNQLPEQVDLMKFASFEDDRLTQSRQAAASLLQQLDFYHRLFWLVAVTSGLALVLFLRNRSRVLAGVSAAWLAAGFLLLLPWLFSNTLLTGVKFGGAFFDFLRDTGLLKATIAAALSAYLVSPLALLAFGIAALIGALVTRSPDKA